MIDGAFSRKSKRRGSKRRCRTRKGRFTKCRKGRR